MVNQYWPQALAEACIQSYHPGLQTDTEDEIVKYFLWHWGKYPDEVWPMWERVFEKGKDESGQFEHDIFPILRRVVHEGKEEDRIYALFYLGALATSEARELLSSSLTSGHRKERWASAIALGRLKDERVFTLLQTYLLEGFHLSEIFADREELLEAQKACSLYRQNLKEQTQVELPSIYLRVIKQVVDLDYEWFLRQRSECALILGAWEMSRLYRSLSGHCKQPGRWNRIGLISKALMNLGLKSGISFKTIWLMHLGNVVPGMPLKICLYLKSLAGFQNIYGSGFAWSKRSLGFL